VWGGATTGLENATRGKDGHREEETAMSLRAGKRVSSGEVPVGAAGRGGRYPGVGESRGEEEISM